MQVSLCEQQKPSRPKLDNDSRSSHDGKFQKSNRKVRLALTQRAHLLAYSNTTLPRKFRFALVRAEV